MVWVAPRGRRFARFAVMDRDDLENRKFSADKDTVESARQPKNCINNSKQVALMRVWSQFCEKVASKPCTQSLGIIAPRSTGGGSRFLYPLSSNYVERDLHSNGTENKDNNDLIPSKTEQKCAVPQPKQVVQ